MTKQDVNKIKEIADNQGWCVRVDGKEITFSKFSPAGQDFNIELRAENLEELVEAIKRRCDNFDCSEEAYLWLDNSGHGKNGAPYDMKDVYEDMEGCLEMMEELRDELNKI